MNRTTTVAATPVAIRTVSALRVTRFFSTTGNLVEAESSGVVTSDRCRLAISVYSENPTKRIPRPRGPRVRPARSESPRFAREEKAESAIPQP